MPSRRKITLFIAVILLGTVATILTSWRLEVILSPIKTTMLVRHRYNSKMMLGFSSFQNVSTKIRTGVSDNRTMQDDQRFDDSMTYSLAYSESGTSAVAVYDFSSKLLKQANTHGTLTNNSVKKILWYDIYHNGNGVRNKARKIDLRKCDMQCSLDYFIFNDTNKIYAPTDADAVLIQLNKMQSIVHPPLKTAGQVFVVVEREACPRHKIPLVNFENVFNWTMTYRRDSDIFYPYGRLVQRTEPLPDKNYSLIYNLKRKSVIWFVSHCRTKSRRENYVKELQNYINVDIYGGCGTFRCPRHGNGSKDCLSKLEEEYFFRIAFENTYHTDYVTEKLYEHFPSTMIQIVDGSAEYDHIVPDRTVINAKDFPSPKELAVYLKSVQDDESKYIEYIKRKDRYDVESLSDQTQRAYCQLCSMLHNRENHTNLYYDVGAWWIS